MHKQDKLSQKKIVWLSFAVSLFIFFCINRFYTKKTGSLEFLYSYLCYPLLRYNYYCIKPLNKYLKHKKKYSDLLREYQNLHNKYEQLQATMVSDQSTQHFFQKTEEIIAFKKRYNPSTIHFAHIILQILDQEKQEFLLDQGSKHGIAKDMAVVYKNNLIGKVDKVFPFYCSVIAVTDKRCHISAYCSKTKTVGIAQGLSEKAMMRLNHVGRLKKVIENDAVFSSGKGTIFPEGFLLGYIKNIQAEQPYYSIEVAPAVDLHKLEYCYILQKGNY